jgi:predicted transcriptional regulator of viral defense system
MEDQNGQYQICGPNAFNRYGFDEQIPTRTYVYNNRISGERTIGAITLMLIKVADKRLGNTEEVKLDDGQPIRYSSRVRTLVDAVYDWSRFNSLPRGYEWIRRELAAKRVDATELVKVTLLYGDVGTIRRMGTLLEREKADSGLLQRLQRALKPTKSLIPWIPSLPKRGITSRRWGVVVNE